ncbi:putative leucine-rich repeat-containing protein DDB_G0290503, partial [Battus philenor]|uniref:putative leucine-rich repeat-containing protein DDB_G0290503 n=1 Tax=Battus philenor TaxID=42288 RepID=UPI0035CEF674
KMSNSSIMSVRDLIEIAFGESSANTVNFKIIQTVLYLLARHLRVLERQVDVRLDRKLDVSSQSSITVTEVKMQAAVAKKKKSKLPSSEAPETKDKTGDKKTKTKDLSQEKPAPKTPSKRGASDPGNGPEKKRVHSREEAEKSPTPMASLDSIEMQYEKLLVGMVIFTEVFFCNFNFQGTWFYYILSFLVERTSSDDARITDESEKKPRKLSVVTQVQFQELAEKVRELQNQIGSYNSATFPENIKLMQELRKGASLTDAMAALQMSARLEAAEKTLEQMLSLITTLAASTPGTDLYENDNTENANNALQLTKKLEIKLEAVTHLAPRMHDLETLVTEYANQINDLDTGLSAQMTNYQEQLTQMQHDLEVALENMAEALANTGGDTTELTELNTNFSLLQEDFDRTLTNQKDLQEVQNSLHLDLQGLWQEIEKLREIKPDREEVSDALRDKAGIKALNGLVTQEHFDAVRGDFQKSIGAAYDKFNNQENVWQKVIDDIFRELSEKADWVQLNSLRTEIDKNIDMLNSRIQAMSAILGEPMAATTTRKLFRDTACLSCSSPAHMEVTETVTMPKIPAFPKSSAKHGSDAEKSLRATGAGDHDICIPGKPVSHPLDPRSEYCHRYCGGGSVTRPIMKHVPIKLDSAMHIESTCVGSDGRVSLHVVLFTFNRL